MSILVVFYSLTANSKKVAELVARLCGCEIEEIKDLKIRKGLVGFLKSGYEAISKKVVEIEDINRDFSKFDHIIMVCPIWAGNLPSPVRAFLKKYLNSIKNISFVFTLASNNKVDITKVFERDFGRKSRCISIQQKLIGTQECEKMVKSFVEEIRI